MCTRFQVSLLWSYACLIALPTVVLRVPDSCFRLWYYAYLMAVSTMVLRVPDSCTSTSSWPCQYYHSLYPLRRRPVLNGGYGATAQDYGASSRRQRKMYQPPWSYALPTPCPVLTYAVGGVRGGGRDRLAATLSAYARATRCAVLS
eukprot:242492-Rhodomonas_salina.1